MTTVGGANGKGVAFKPHRSYTGAWILKPLYAFKDQPDDALPYGGLTFDRSGNLYGTTYYAGAHDVGTVYKLTHRDDSWTESVLYSFKGTPDGSSPSVLWSATPRATRMAPRVREAREAVTASSSSWLLEATTPGRRV